MMSARSAMRSLRNCEIACSWEAVGALYEVGCAVAAGSADQAGMVNATARAAKSLEFMWVPPLERTR